MSRMSGFAFLSSLWFEIDISCKQIICMEAMGEMCSAKYQTKITKGTLALVDYIS